MTGPVLTWRGHPASRSSYQLLAVPMYSVLTRVRLRHVWDLPRMLLAYRSVRRTARNITGLKRCAFLLQDLRTFVILSIWEGEDGFLDFGTYVTAHLDAARQALHAALRVSGKVEIWSTEWQIRATSHNIQWGDQHDWVALHNALAESASSTPETRDMDQGGQ